MMLIIGFTIFLKWGRRIQCGRKDLILPNYHWNRCCCCMCPWHMVTVAETPSILKWFRILIASITVVNSMYMLTCSWLSCFHVHILYRCRMTLVHIVKCLHVRICVTPWRLGRINCLLNQLAYSDMTPGTWWRGFDSSSNLAKFKKQILDKQEIGKWQTLNSPLLHYHEFGDGLSSKCT